MIRYARWIVGSLIVPFVMQAQAWALPGHSIQQEKSWANQNLFLLELEPAKDENGRNLFRTQRKTEKGSLIEFAAKTEPKAPETVATEVIVIQASDGEMKGLNQNQYFAENHKKMFVSLVDTIYGAILTPDYDGAELDVKLDIGGITYFYRGKRYGYLVSYNLGTAGCQNPAACKHRFTWEIFDLTAYKDAVTAGRNQKKNQPVNVNIFPM